MRLNVVSMSSGKDSTATALLALETEPRESLRFVTADTGNEHELYYEYLEYLEERLGIQIVRLRQDFTEWWWNRRDYIRDVWPEKLVTPQRKKVGKGKAAFYVNVPAMSREDADATIARCLAVFDKGPTGNPYLDLCIIKQRFPSRKAQFCTEFLKTKPLAEFCMNLIDEGNAVWSWQGVRADESPERALLASFEEVGGGLYNYRPILRWTAMDCIEAHHAYGIEPNPLYKQGQDRVGCMPCINTNKAAITEIANRFPKHLDRIAEWEAVVTAASKRGDTSFFPDPDRDAHLNKRGIRNVIQWAKTTRGGRQYDLLANEEPSMCSSAYGLCE